MNAPEEMDFEQSIADAQAALDRPKGKQNKSRLAANTPSPAGAAKRRSLRKAQQKARKAQR